MILRLLKHPLLLIAAIVIGCYFASDILESGRTLNASFPGVYLGWAFWGGIALLLWVIVFSPIISFFGLPRWVDVSSASDSEQVKILTAYAKKMEKYGGRMVKRAKTEEQAAILKQHTEALGYAYKSSAIVDEKARRLRDVVSDFRQYVMAKELSRVVRRYAYCASGAVIISRKGFLDSFILFGLQIKLMIELSRNLGHKPSWAFILCCCLWVAINSLFISLLDEGDVVGALGSSLSEIFSITAVNAGGGVLENVPFVQTLGKQAMESLYAGGTVYVTGMLVLKRLMGESKRLTPKELLKLRLEGLKGMVNLRKEGNKEVTHQG